MELCHYDLEDTIGSMAKGQGKVKLWTICEGLGQILRAVERVVAARVVHRNIKPNNIFIDMWGRFRMGDFGLARGLHMKQGEIATCYEGTNEFFAPEAASGLRSGSDLSKIDLFSVGVVLFQMITGKTPLGKP